MMNKFGGHLLLVSWIPLFGSIIAEGAQFLEARLQLAEEQQLPFSLEPGIAEIDEIERVLELRFESNEENRYRLLYSNDGETWNEAVESPVMGNGQQMQVHLDGITAAHVRVIELIEEMHRPATGTDPRLPPIEGLRIHLDASADEALSLDGHFVEEWGSGEIVFRPWRELRPVRISDAGHGRPAIRFQGASLDTSSEVALSLTNNISGLTFFGVGANTGSGIQSYLRISTGDNAGKIRADFSRSHADHRFRGRRLDDDPFQTVIGGGRIDGEWTIDSTVIDYEEANAFIFSNGRATGSVRAFQEPGRTEASDSLRFRIGSDTRNDPGGFWNGDIAEILVFDRALEREELNTIGAYLSDKYGIPYTLLREREIEVETSFVGLLTFETSDGHRYRGSVPEEAINWPLVSQNSTELEQVIIPYSSGEAISVMAVERITGELLYNGIRLPREWPPTSGDPNSAEPMPVPYLERPPRIIPIDVGRQLFVDDFLIEETNLERTFHRPWDYEKNPVLVPATAHELDRTSGSEGEHEAVAYLGHGGAFYDPEDQLFKMWYSAGWRGGLAYVTSKNGFDWERPDMGLASDNLVLARGGDQAGWDHSIWLDVEAESRDERIKFLTQRPGRSHTLHTSADQREWFGGVETGMAADYCSFFHNPFRDVWVFSIKRNSPRGRSRDYAESREFLQEGVFSQSVYWTNADRLDPPDPEVGDPTQLYSLNGVAYESLILGMHYIHRGPNNTIADEGRFPKMTELSMGFSRDGFHWDRPDRRPFIEGSREEGTWNRAYLHGTTGVCLVVGDYLYFPYTGFSGESPTGWTGMYTGASIGMAILRRDGFASMDADGRGGSLVTRPVSFSGRHLFVNVDSVGGIVRVEVLDEQGAPIPGFTMDECQPLSVDSTLQKVTWNEHADLSQFAGQPVRFRFYLEDASLYAFWVSENASGASGGYVAAGGPGFSGSRDIEGDAAYREAERILNHE